ncbi:hypothetical protein [Franzmannia qiaohouensis]|uniref:RiPP n=1 Tax=Franzmannia qiaohouensis TaxID=1329370 RepID=A0ABU1HHS4_9GAMM|nr:hypothetical protein [Halomonas qiaohouensis]MDR5906851.1 hypothetical protein [Halomonas qiaohouensis]
MKTDKKEKYVSPVIVSLGSPSEITQSGDLPNADTPGGLNNTANKPGS